MNMIDSHEHKEITLIWMDKATEMFLDQSLCLILHHQISHLPNPSQGI